MTAALAFDARLVALGFDYVNTGGDVMQWVRSDGQVEELICGAIDPDVAIASKDDRVSLYTRDLSDDHSGSDEPDNGCGNVPLWAFLEAWEKVATATA